MKLIMMTVNKGIKTYPMSPPVSVTKNQQQPYIQTATNCVDVSNTDLVTDYYEKYTAITSKRKKQ
jgi:hypothetical protein